MLKRDECRKWELRKVRSIVVLAVLAFGAMVWGPAANAQTEDHHFIELNVPGAGGIYFAGTNPWQINNLGQIGGWYGANDIISSFVRYQDGRLVTYNAPAQGTAATSGTIAFGLTDEGLATGVSFKQFGEFYYSFIRKPDGTFITFTPPGPCATVVDSGCFGNGAASMTDLGLVVGITLLDNRVFRPFIRWPDGRIETFKAPGASEVAGSYAGTFINEGRNVVNQFGAITGDYEDVNGVYHGFVRWPDGSFSTFDAPGADSSPQSKNGTFAQSINDLGVVTGWYVDANDVYHGFVRRPDGDITTFDAPGADMTPGSFNGTLPSNLNVFGEVIGGYYDAEDHGHGFVRYPDGRIWQFDPPNYTNDIQVQGINAEGVVVGDAVNDNLGLDGTHSGFVLLPGW